MSSQVRVVERCGVGIHAQSYRGHLIRSESKKPARARCTSNPDNELNEDTTKIKTISKKLK